MSTSLSLAIVVSGQFSVSFALTLEARSRSPQRANSTSAARPSMLHIVCTALTRARLLWPRLGALEPPRTAIWLARMTVCTPERARWAVRNSRSVLKNDDAASRKVVAVSQPFRLDLGSIILHNTYSCFQKFPHNLVPK